MKYLVSISGPELSGFITYAPSIGVVREGPYVTTNKMFARRWPSRRDAERYIVVILKFRLADEPTPNETVCQIHEVEP